jgi:hypothetical protein
MEGKGRYLVETTKRHQNDYSKQEKGMYVDRRKDRRSEKVGLT